MEPRGGPTIDFQRSPEQKAGRSGIEQICQRFPDDYGLARDRGGGFPHELHAMLAKYLATEAGFKACQTAVLVHGGYGYAREYHVECSLREMMIPRIAPVSPQLILCDV